VAIIPNVKRPQCESDYSTASSADIYYVWKFNSMLPYDDDDDDNDNNDDMENPS